MNIYYISGLGADERAFDKLDFVTQHHATYIPWLKPFQKKEAIEAYAKRMAESIKDENPVLIGLSFGGMMAIEIAKLIKIKKIILISSCKTKDELPPQIKMAGALGLDALLPNTLVKSSKPVIHNFLGTISAVEKEIANDFIDHIDDDYLSWAMRSISRWKNTEIPCPIFHIHGNSDMLLPNNFVQADHIIEGGNHFMIYNKANEINPVLNVALQGG